MQEHTTQEDTDRLLGTSGVGAQYLTFFLAGEEYGVGILDVQEVRAWEGVTQIPNAPLYVKGVLDLRGQIVPIVDLRTRFGLPVQDYTATTVIIVLKLEDDSETQIIGIVVDAVSDVLDVVEENIKDAPEFSNVEQNDFIKGLANHHNNLVILLHTDKLLSKGELVSLKKHAEVEATESATSH